MGNINVAVIGPAGYGGGLGKKGTSTEITFYNLKRGEDTVTLIEPSKYPERLAPLFYAVSMARMAILVVEEISPAFGECVLMLHCAGVRSGFIVLRNFIPKEKVMPLIRGTAVEGYEFVGDEQGALRERLLGEAAKSRGSPTEEVKAGAAVVDHAFSVKGVGTVALGTVARGAVRRHDALKVVPGGKVAEVRSIQKHDDDFEWSVEGDRVGLALKNVEVDDLDRGAVLTNDAAVKTAKRLEVGAELLRYWPAPIKQGMAIHLGHWMQFVPARVEAVSDAGDWRKPNLALALEKELAYVAGGTAVLMYLSGQKLRVVGTVRLQ